MKEIKLPKASRLTSPNPITIVCSQKPDGSTNLATVSWWTYLSYNPGMVAFAMAKTSYSGKIELRSIQCVSFRPKGAISAIFGGCGGGE